MVVCFYARDYINIVAAASKNDAYFKSGQKRLKNKSNYMFLLSCKCNSSTNDNRRPFVEQLQFIRVSYLRLTEVSIKWRQILLKAISRHHFSDEKKPEILNQNFFMLFVFSLAFKFGRWRFDFFSEVGWGWFEAIQIILDSFWHPCGFLIF